MSSSRYWELTVGVPPDASEGLTNFVWELGALGVVEEEAPGRAPRLRAFFPKTLFANALEASVREYLGSLRELGFRAAALPSVVALANEDWAEAWRAHFRPFAAGRTLTIAPPWERPPANGRVVITIEPGRAFGTGQHGSTLGCLRLLEALIAREPPARLLDLGTGSGILAIAAARLGVGQVLAVDEDPDAVASAMANVARNRVSDRVRCVLADAGGLQESRTPLVAANLLTAAHLRLAPQYRRYVAPGGALVLGGILDAEASTVAAALGRHGFAPQGSVGVDGWTTLHLRREPGELARAPLHDRA
ncbi:MAG: 50S ribosomal protein L11 methyltransferase [Candidatus Rokuibacteriota bacterium]